MAVTDLNEEWLGHVQPVGLVVASVVLARLDLVPSQQTRADWDAEIDGEILGDEGWASVAKLGTDDPSVFSAYLRALRWNTATAADRDLFQAPFRAGIHLDAYQLLPLRKALRLPRVNLLIADDVGAGKTVEAGLVLREMLLRRRVDFVLVAAPAGMVRQWQDELEVKFGLAFTIVDREYLAILRRERGYGASPWASGTRFIISHSLLADETYVGGLRDLLGEFRPRALLILDEAHHAAPASGSRYAIDSQFTRSVRGLADRFEHRLLFVGHAAQRPFEFIFGAARNPRPAALHPRRLGQAARPRPCHGPAPQRAHDWQRSLERPAARSVHRIRGHPPLAGEVLGRGA